MFSLLDLLPRTHPPIRIVDVGAMWTGDEIYAPLLARGACHVTGFEPQETQRRRLNAARPDIDVLPYVIGDGTTRTFHTCRYPGCSSLYEPDAEMIGRFAGISTGPGSNFEVLARERVETRRLDDIADVRARGCDFLKLDIQGAELDALTGAISLLHGILLIQLEVEFLPIYRGQPLFSDIDVFLRAHGFVLHKLLDVSGRAYLPFQIAGNPGHPLSQILWADAVYIPSFERLDILTAEQLLTLALILHDVYASIDLCAALLEAYERKGGLPLATLYMKHIAQAGDIPITMVTSKPWSD